MAANQSGDKSLGNIRFEVEDFSKINKERVYSPPCFIYHLPWRISAGPELRVSSKKTVEKFLGFYLECNGESTSSSWYCLADVTLYISRPKTLDVRKRFHHLYYSKSISMGFGDFIAWNDIIDSEKVLLKDDQITLEAIVHIRTSNILTFGCLGTKGKLLHSRIVSTGAKESNYDENTNEYFHFIVENFSRLKTDLIFSPQIIIHNFPWRIGVKRDSSNEFLVFRLFCDKKSKSSWKFFAQVELAMVSQKHGVADYVKKLVQFYSAQDKDWGFGDFIEWNDIVDPENGFINNDVVILRATLCVDTHSNATVSCITPKAFTVKEVITPMNDTPDGIERMIFVVENFSKITKSIFSRYCTTRSLFWAINISLQHEKASELNSEKAVALHLYCNDKSDENIPWSCFVHARITLISQLPKANDFIECLETIFHPYLRNWGFPKFMSWKDITDSSRGYIKNDRIILKVEFFVDIPRGISWDSKQETGFIGLKNQPETCFMNSLVQTLYFINILRKTIYQIPTENDYDGRNLVLALQRTFYKLEISDEPVSSAELTKCLRHEAMDIFSPIDLPEFLYLLFNKLGTVMKETGVDSPIKNLFECKIEEFTKCTEIDYEIRTSKTLYSIELEMEYCGDIEEAIVSYTYLDDPPVPDDGKFDTGVHGLQYVRNGVIFTSLPSVLIVTLNQFGYNRYTGCREKSNLGYFEMQDKIKIYKSCLKSPEAIPANYSLLAALVQGGDSENGRFVVFIDPKCKGTWYEFDGDIVSKCPKEIAVENNDGGPHNDFRNAYMLVYILDSELKNVLQEVTVDDIPTELRNKFEKDFEAEQDKREEHDRLYITVNVLLDDCFDGHQGHDLFDLAQIPDPLDHEGSLIRLFKVKKDTAIDELMILLSESFGRPLNQMRIWPFDKRSNGSYRPTYLNLNADTDETEEVSDFLNDDSWNIFLEVPADIGDYHLPMFNKNSQVLLFFKEYNPCIQTFYYCQHGYFEVNSTLAQLVSKLNENAGYPPDTKLILYKEIAAHELQKIIVDPITSNKSLKEISTDLSTGDIIVFQKNDPNLPNRSLLGVKHYFRSC